MFSGSVGSCRFEGASLRAPPPSAGQGTDTHSAASPRWAGLGGPTQTPGMSAGSQAQAGTSAGHVPDPRPDTGVPALHNQAWQAMGPCPTPSGGQERGTGGQWGCRAKRPPPEGPWGAASAQDPLLSSERCSPCPRPAQLLDPPGQCPAAPAVPAVSLLGQGRLFPSWLLPNWVTEGGGASYQARGTLVLPTEPAPWQCPAVSGAKIRPASLSDPHLRGNQGTGYAQATRQCLVLGGPLWKPALPSLLMFTQQFHLG